MLSGCSSGLSLLLKGSKYNAPRFAIFVLRSDLGILPAQFAVLPGVQLHCSSLVNQQPWPKLWWHKEGQVVSCFCVQVHGGHEFMLRNSVIISWTWHFPILFTECWVSHHETQENHIKRKPVLFSKNWNLPCANPPVVRSNSVPLKSAKISQLFPVKPAMSCAVSFQKKKEVMVHIMQHKQMNSFLWVFPEFLENPCVNNLYTWGATPYIMISWPDSRDCTHNREHQEHQTHLQKVKRN